MNKLEKINAFPAHSIPLDLKRKVLLLDIASFKEISATRCWKISFLKYSEDCLRFLDHFFRNDETKRKPFT